MEYRVLARKYRPTNFDDLIGQEVLVRTLSNAISSGRIAHGFLLTGIRGVGKTTTARIIARALTCVGEDGQGGPTINPCGVCSNCRMIAEDRHVDILEMDAASHTGVNDIRELIESVRYLPSSARYKIYIIDEVHMLSNSAFNALLKTLEEPPPHVKFIFATTEARKIPVTILSRCQRFDLKRVDMDTLAAHLAKIAQKENITIDEEALKLIALCAEGSVRDSLSLLDQAIARGADQPSIDASLVRQMIGASDHSASFSMLTRLLTGNIAEAMEAVKTQYIDGADPLLLLQDYLDIVHLVTRVKVAPAALQDVSLSQHDRDAAKGLADQVSMAVLARLWQMLLKGIQEVRVAPSPIAALEMLMVRVAYAAQLPTPAEAIRSGVASTPAATIAPANPASAEKKTPIKPTLEVVNAAQPDSAESYEEAVALFSKHREALLYTRLKQDLGLVRFEPGQMTLKPYKEIARDFAPRVAECLTKWTGKPWKVLITDEEATPSLHEQEIARKEQTTKELSSHPLVASVFEQFPGAKMVGVTSEK
ncbi:MAG: DNA polymerase III subunit gamma/tau [Rickettsiales bacterium]|nr:DNA polymerase III subunit gamma/tau [Rickettsiales bacterium]